MSFNKTKYKPVQQQNRIIGVVICTRQRCHPRLEIIITHTLRLFILVFLSFFLSIIFFLLQKPDFLDTGLTKRAATLQKLENQLSNNRKCVTIGLHTQMLLSFMRSVKREEENSIQEICSHQHEYQKFLFLLLILYLLLLLRF